MLPSITASHCKRNPNVDTSDIRNTTYVNFVRSVTIPSGTTYRYVFAPPSDTTKPYLLFIHGFPETSYEWSHQITYFTEQGYGVIVPDLLGCGGTDTPRALTLYGFKSMAADVGQILDCEGVEKVIGVSHDLGSPLLSRFVINQPSRFTAVAFLGNGYFPPAARVDAAGVDFINEAALARFGYETVGFWSFNNEENAAKVFDQHLESFSTLSFTRNTSLWIDHLAPTQGSDPLHCKSTWTTYKWPISITSTCRRSDYLVIHYTWT
ncbi:putative WD repeat-containing protein [Fusarium oxysporum f. sp. albedinis]|nr:putative WD repeat-containing protein [Fusarium oxysporum f. sp. albedinis]